MPSLYCVGSDSATAWQTQITRTAADWVKAFGGVFAVGDPLAAQYVQIVNRDMPPKLPAKSQVQWKACAEACMRLRSFLYCTTTVGDAATARPASYSKGIAAPVVGMGLKTAAALDPEPISKGILAVASLFTGIFSSLFKTEDAQRIQVLTAAAQQVPPAIAQIDAAVVTVQITAAQGVAALQSIAQQFRATANTYSHPGNSIEAYAAILDCIADISPAYYDLKKSSAAGTGNAALLGGAAIVGAKLYGLF